MLHIGGVRGDIVPQRIGHDEEPYVSTNTYQRVSGKTMEGEANTLSAVVYGGGGDTRMWGTQNCVIYGGP